MLIPFRHRVRATIHCSVLIAALTALAPALGQSTGNPKGSAAPSTQGAPAKPAADPKTPSANGSPGPILDSTRGPASARTQRTEPPGGGPAGGLADHFPQDKHPSAKSATGKAAGAPRPGASTRR
jgi:hypothetical protein